jgi:anaerobic selenocysteine-containing dehydrogenase
LHEKDAKNLGVAHGDVVEVTYGSERVRVRASVKGQGVEGLAIMPKHLADKPIPMQPTPVTISKVLEPVLA